jgi:hypothetical protein
VNPGRVVGWPVAVLIFRCGGTGGGTRECEVELSSEASRLSTGDACTGGPRSPGSVRDEVGEGVTGVISSGRKRGVTPEGLKARLAWRNSAARMSRSASAFRLSDSPVETKRCRCVECADMREAAASATWAETEALRRALFCAAYFVARRLCRFALRVRVGWSGTTGKSRGGGAGSGLGRRPAAVAGRR